MIDPPDLDFHPAGAIGRVEELRHGGLTWLTIERPGPAELALLAGRFGFHPLDLDDLVSRTERPKLDRYDEYNFVVLHFPTLLARPRRLATGELHLFIGRDFVVTVHDGDLRAPVRLFDDVQRDATLRARDMDSPERLAYAVVMSLVEATSPHITRLSAALDGLSEEVFEERSGEPVRGIAQLRRETIQLRRMLRQDAAVIDALRHAARSADSGLADYWDNASDQLHRLVDFLEDLAQTLEAISHSYDQLTNVRINNTMRALTALSTLLLPLSVLSGIYGMNVRRLPWAENDWGFEIVLGLMLAVAIALLAVFRRRGWI